MELKNQICSLELAKKLKELGCKQESLFCWVSEKDMQKNGITYSVQMALFGKTGSEYISAFTVAELGEMLPWYVNEKNVFAGQLMCWKSPNGHTVVYGTLKEIYHKETADTEADARAAMLAYLIENKLLTP